MYTNNPVLMCVLHEADPEGASATAISVILGLAVCETCLTAILDNFESHGSRYTAEDYIRDAQSGGWVSS